MARGELVQFGFRGGVDEKTDPKQAQPGTLVSLVNMRQDKTGRLARRLGHSALTKSIASGGTISAAHRLMTSKDELLLSDGTALYGYSTALVKWVKHDTVTRCLPRWSMVQQSPTDWSNPQYAYGNGFAVFVWLQSTTSGTPGDVYVMVQDVASGAIALPATLVSNGSATSQLPKVLITGTVCAIAWSDTSGKIIGSLLDMTAPQNGVGAPVNIQIDQNTSTPFWDAVETTAGVFSGIYSDTTATPKLKAFRCTVALPATITVTHTVDSTETLGLYTSPCIAYDATQSRCVVAYGGSTPFPTPTTFHTRIYAFSPTDCSHVAGPTTLSSPASQITQAGICQRTVSPGVSEYHAYFVMSGAADAGQYWTISTTFTLTQRGMMPGQFPATRPWTDGTDVYILLPYADTNYIAKFDRASTASKSAMIPIATVAPRIAYAPANISGSGSNPLDSAARRVINVGGSRYMTSGTVIADAASQSRVCLTSLDIQMGDAWLMNGDAFPAQHHEAVEFGDLLHLSGGMPSSFDGQKVVEMGFLYGPQDTDITLTAAGSGGGLGAGTYQYRICYEWTDNRGQVYRSPPSVAKSVTTVATDKVTLTIPNLWLTKKSGVQIIVYRTTVNGDGSLFYRQTPYSVPAGNINNAAARYATIVDTTNDANLTAVGTQTLLYTNGGTLDAQCPSGLACLIKHQRRLAGIGDDGRTVWLSNEYVDREAPRWNDEWQMQFDEPLTALATLDDKLIAFSERSIWFVTGEGPTDAGTSNDWSTPEQIQSDTGCVDPRGVIHTADGIIFQAQRGFYLLDRALNVTFVGALIEDTTATNPLLTCSLSHVVSETSCFFGMQSSSAASLGIRMHWDTFYRMWAVDKLTDGATAGAAIAGLVEWNDVLVWATAGGQVYQQFAGVWTDNGNWYDSSFTTAVISAGGPLGFQRVRFVQVEGTWASNHDLRLSLAFDGAGSYAQHFQFTAAEMALKQNERVKLRVGSQNGANPRCGGLQIKVEILTPTTPGTYPIGTGQAATLTGLGLEIVPKPGQNRVGATVQV